MQRIWTAAVAVALAGCAHKGPLPGSFAEQALITSDSACHTFDLESRGPLEYTCYVHSKQTDGKDVSAASGRAEVVERRLSATCSRVDVTRDEPFRTDATGAMVWRVLARCARAQG